MFLIKLVLKICNKFTGEHPCRSAISIKLLCNSTEITLRHWCFPVNLFYIFRTTFPRNTSSWLRLIHAYPWGKYLNELEKHVLELNFIKFAASQPQLTQLQLHPSFIEFTVENKVWGSFSQISNTSSVKEGVKKGFL